MQTHKAPIPWKLKWYNSIRTRLFLAFSLLVAIIAIFIYLYFPARLRAQALAGTQEQAASFAEFLAFTLSPAVYFGDTAESKEPMMAVKLNELVSFVAVYDKAGMRFASYGDVSRTGEAVGVPNGGMLSADGNFWLTATPVMHKDEEIGRLYVGHSLDKMKADVLASKISPFEAAEQLIRKLDSMQH